MFKLLFILAVVLVVPAFFIFTWLMSKYHRRKNAKPDVEDNAKISTIRPEHRKP